MPLKIVACHIWTLTQEVLGEEGEGFPKQNNLVNCELVLCCKFRILCTLYFLKRCWLDLKLKSTTMYRND